MKRPVGTAVMKMVLSVLMASLATGCATIISGTSQSVQVNSEPGGAFVEVNGINRGQTPTVLTLPRNQDQSIAIRLDGYDPYSVNLTRGLNGWFFGNIIFGGVIGVVVDVVDGAVFKLEPDNIQAFLTPAQPGTPRPAPSAPASPLPPRPPPKQPDPNAPTCAVLMFEGRSGISAQEASLLTDRFVVEINALGKYRLISRSMTDKILDEQKFARTLDCSASDCAVEAGRLLGVRYMVYGSIGRIGNLYTVNAYLVSVETGQTESSATADTHGGLEDVLTKGMAAAAAQLAEQHTKAP